MEIGKKLKKARTNSGLTQEQISEEIQVSRQTISNWENEKSYPDIISILKLSNLYNISLDELLKGDADMMKHLDESTNIVDSNKKLLIAITLNGLLLLLFIFCNGLIANNHYLMLGSVAIGVVSTSALFYQIIRRL
jgi:transcriptional regulator with XRE-family HTH domain